MEKAPITQEAVAGVAEKLRTQGKKTSLASIREALRGGDGHDIWRSTLEVASTRYTVEPASLSEYSGPIRPPIPLINGHLAKSFQRLYGNLREKHLSRPPGWVVIKQSNEAIEAMIAML